MRRAWEDVERFYALCAEVTEPTELMIEASRPTKWDDDSLIWPVLDRTLQHFGTPDFEQLHGSTMWPSGELTKGGVYQWRRTMSQLEADFDYLIAGEPWPKSVIGPVTLNFRQSFHWRHPGTQQPLAHAHPNATTSGGRFSLSFGRRCFVQPSLSFPFVYDDPAFLEFLHAIRPHLPFRMHSNHFRRIILGRKPDAFQVRKMPWPVVLT